MLALELFKSKLEPLKTQLKNDVWYLQNFLLHGKDVITTKTIFVKLIMGILMLNPLFLTPGIVLMDMRPDWSIYPAEEPSRRAVMLTFYILFMLASCGVVYAHMLVYVYFTVYLKMEMELLSKYFQDVSSKLLLINLTET